MRAWETPEMLQQQLAGMLINGHFGLWYDMARYDQHRRARHFSVSLTQHVLRGWMAFQNLFHSNGVQFRSKARPLRLTTWWRDPRPTLLGLHMFSCSRLGCEDLTTLWSSPVATGFRGQVSFHIQLRSNLVYLGLILESLGMSWSFSVKVWNAFWFCLFDCQYGVVLHFCGDLREPNRTSLYWQA